MINKLLKCVFIPLGLIFLLQCCYVNMRDVFHHHIFSPIMESLYLKLNNNFLLINPIETFVYHFIFDVFYICLIILVLWKIKVNLKILKQIDLKKVAFFIALVCTLKLIIFFAYIGLIKNSASFFKITNHFNTFEEKNNFYWREFIHEILKNIIRHGIIEELLFRVLYVFIIYKFSKSLLWSILLSSIIFTLFHFYLIGNSFPFLFLSGKIGQYSIFHMIIGAFIFFLLLIMSNNLITPIFYHFFHNTFEGIYYNQFKPIIESTITVPQINFHTLGIPVLEFIHILTNSIIFIVLLILFFRKRKYYLERYEANWLMPVTKSVLKK